MALCAHQTAYHIGDDTILHPMDIDIVGGQVTAVLGENGAGKSSLLNILAGCPTASEGYVSLEGRRLTDWDWQEVATRRGVLTQGAIEGGYFSVEQMVQLGANPHSKRHSKKFAKQAVIQMTQQMFDWFGMDALKRKRYSQLSGGERQRTQLARVFLQVMLGLQSHPMYLLLDEPSANLDIHYQRLFLARMQELTKLGVGVLMVTHDLNHAWQYADKVVLLKSGSIYAQGKPEQVMSQDNLTTIFGQGIAFLHNAQGKSFIVVENKD